MSSALSAPSSRRHLLRPTAIAAIAAMALVCLAVACAPARQGPAVQNAQLLAPPKDSCELAREDARLDPRLDVERVPTPVKMDPPPIKRPVPPMVLRRSRGDTIKAEVLIDTLGRPDMTTFAMLTSPDSWYTTNLKPAIAQWRFEPALRNGCKVPRYYLFSVSLVRRPRR
ncbi:MAG: hypothetical protein P2973_06925 [Gemmatimonadota bacterium]|jgi:hypothetical protein|nr:hypothetical protein [Gemmatimonadota bacterium]MDQ8178990.1 hypothetical protein [Gemmatimonadota bacterium]